METNNETVEQVYAEAMQTTGAFPSRQTYAKRYLAAHKREIAAKDDARLTVVSNYETVIAAKDRIIAAKDTEIESLKDENTRLRVMVGGASVAEGYLREEIERLRALVKELSKIVDGPLCHQDCALCPPDTRCASKRLRALVTKAREVVK